MSDSRNLLAAVDRTMDFVRDSEPLERSALTRSLAEVRALTVQTEAALADAEKEIRNLSNLYVIHVRLYEELTPQAVADAVTEIVINFVGSEDFAVYLARDGGFHPSSGKGPAFDSAQPFREGDPGPGTAVRESDVSYATAGAVALTAFVDAQGRPCGLLEIRSLMRHKRWLNNKDKELLALLRAQVGVALQVAFEREARR